MIIILSKSYNKIDTMEVSRIFRTLYLQIIQIFLDKDLKDVLSIKKLTNANTQVIIDTIFKPLSPIIINQLLHLRIVVAESTTKKIDEP